MARADEPWGRWVNMGTETAALIVPRAAEHAKPLSTAFVSSLLRLSDLSIVFIAGVAVHRS